jgi:hypothetical protein
VGARGKHRFGVYRRGKVLNPLETVITVFTNGLTFGKFHLFAHTVCYVFCVDLRTNSDYFPIQH